MSKSTQLDFSGQDVFIGLDTHLKSWKATVLCRRHTIQLKFII